MNRLVGFDWAVRESVKNALMLVPPIVHLRKRFFSRENDPLARIGEYCDLQWRTYGNAIRLSGATLEKADVLELGPGPILANGIRFIAEGAASYTALDRFDVIRRDHEVIQAYRELISHFPPEQQRKCSGLVTDNPGRRLFDNRIESVVAKIEEASDEIGGRKWDFVVSFDVLEHIDDLAATMRTIRSLLKPGGMMIHRVDVTIHNAPTDVHRLSHLVFSERAWRMISSRRAVCNRIRPSEFLAVAKAVGFETLHFEPTTLLDQEDVAAIRPRLSKKFADCSFEDLAVLDFVWIARAPA